LGVDVDESGEQEGDGLTRTSLGNTNDVKAAQGCGPALALDGTGVLEFSGELLVDVAGEIGFFEIEDGSWGRSTSDDDLMFITEIVNFFLGFLSDGFVLIVKVLLEGR